MLSGCGQNQICPPLLWQMFGADHFSQGVFVGSVEAPCQPFTGSSLPCRQMSLCSGSQSRLSPQPLESQHFPSAAGASVGMNLSKSHSVPLLHGINLHPALSPQPPLNLGATDHLVSISCVIGTHLCFHSPKPAYVTAF